MSDLIGFRGDYTWKPVTLPKPNTGGFGNDRLSVLWRGSRPLLAEFEASLEGIQWAPMQEFREGSIQWFPGRPFMFLETWQDSGGTENFPGRELTYTGFLDGVVPIPKSVDSRAVASAQGVGTYDGDQFTGTFQYYASRTSWTWYETTTPPAVPRHRTVNIPVDPLTTIFAYSITSSAANQPINSIPPADLGAAFNGLTRVNRYIDYSCELLVPGKLWACSCSGEYGLQ